MALQLGGMASALTCANDRIRGNRGPRRVLVTPPGHGRSAKEIDMEQVTPACARSTKRMPHGRTGTVAGYRAHRGIREAVCGPCLKAWYDSEARRKATLSPVFLEREREKSAERARRRRQTTNACATSDGASARQGTVAGYLAHTAAGQDPCRACRSAADRHDWGPVCARPTKAYPAGRTGTRAGFHAHKYALEDACDACLTGAATVQAQRRIEEPDLSLRASLWSKYRLSLEAYEEMLAAQGRACAICGVTAPTDVRTSRFHVDHDHACCPGPKSCGKCVRGLLCHACNTALGNFQDDPRRLLAAVAYLNTRKGAAASAVD